MVLLGGFLNEDFPSIPFDALEEGAWAVCAVRREGASASVQGRARTGELVLQWLLGEAAEEPEKEDAGMRAKHCPFCGSSWVTCEGNAICCWMVCQKCLAAGPEVDTNSSHVPWDVAMKLWNQRKCKRHVKEP